MNLQLSHSHELYYCLTFLEARKLYVDGHSEILWLSFSLIKFMKYCGCYENILKLWFVCKKIFAINSLSMQLSLDEHSLKLQIFKIEHQISCNITHFGQLNYNSLLVFSFKLILYKIIYLFLGFANYMLVQ